MSSEAGVAVLLFAVVEKRLDRIREHNPNTIAHNFAMRFSALIPVALCAASLVLTFLCLFAGNKQGFMENYAVLTLNTSRIGQNLLDTSSSFSDPLLQFLDSLSDEIVSEIEDGITSIARELGVHDFYSAHLMDYCEGYFKPGPIPNATLSKSNISKNVTSCSNHTDFWNFDPREIIQRELDESGHGEIDLLTTLNWPEEIDKGIRALRVVARATFVLYCIAAGFIGVALVSALISIFFEGRLSAFFNIVLDWLAFIVVGIASALATAIAVKGADVINQYGNDIGLSANQGNKFLAITWVATGLMLLASIVWCFDCLVGGRRRSSRKGRR